MAAKIQKSFLAERLAATEPSVRAIYVSTYPPRECGIATYTKNLTDSINILNPHYLADIVAIDDESLGAPHHDYPWEVKYKIDQPKLASWITAAEYINQSGADVVNIQHEFGIMGGENGEYVIHFMDAITKPIVICFHTVLPNPNERVKELVKKITDRAVATIVIVNAARELLIKDYGVDPETIVVIPHGVPDIPFGSTTYFKKILGYENHNIITSFGLMGRSKGYEVAIKAMPEVIKKHPHTKLLLLGETHPVVRRNEGEGYRQSLEELVKQNNLEKNVIFVDRYLTLDEIVQHLRASDIYLTPYPNLNQVSSGTLSYALSAGIACISTPYIYAKEMFNNGSGLLMEPGDSSDLVEKINLLLDNPKKRLEMAKKAYALGRNMIWSRVAYRHLDLFELVINSNHESCGQETEKVSHESIARTV